MRAEPDRCVLVGAYALGKAQRVMAELRAAGWDAPIYIHGAMEKMCALYAAHGVDLGELRLVSETDKAEMAGQIIVAPPSALNDRWSRRLPDPVTAMASGWMRVRQRARQRMVELPLVISDHADWDELTTTISRGEPEGDVDHPRQRGRPAALVRTASAQGARAASGRPRSGGGGVKAFAALIDRLIYTRSRNSKLALIADYLTAHARSRSRLGDRGADREPGFPGGEIGDGADIAGDAGR